MPRRRERRVLGTLIVALLLPLAAAAEPAHDADKATNGGGNAGGGLFDLGQMSKSKEPIVITSDMLEYDYKANVVVYRGDVAAAQGQVKLRSDTLTVTLAPRDDSRPANGGTKPPAPAE